MSLCLLPIGCRSKAAPDFMTNKNDGKSYYAIAQNDKDGIIHLCVYDEANPTDPDVLQLINDKTFIENFPKFFNHRFKGVVISLLEYNPPNYSSNYEFCCDIRRRLATLKIPYLFAARTEKTTSMALISENITSKVGDVVISVMVGKATFLICEYKFTENGYMMVGNRSARYLVEPEAMIKANIMGSCNPTVILGFTLFDFNITARLAKIMKEEKKFIMVDFKAHGYKYPGEMVKWMADKSYTKFFVQPIAWRTTGIIGVMGKDASDLFGINCDTQLPTKKSCIVSKKFSHYIICSINESNKSQDQISGKELSKNCHKTEITVAMDIQQFLSVSLNEIIIPEIQDLPKKLDECMKSKIPVIGFFDNSSVICVSKDDGNYKFLEQWGGLYGNEMFINFETQPTKYGRDAITPFKTSMNSIVFDLIKILTMPINDIKKDPRWKFKIITDNSDYPLLIEFIKHDGNPGAQSPAFLMAMLLKEQIRQIREELGEKPNEIGFCFFDEYNVAEKSRLKEKLREACGLLKINCSFVKF